MKCPHCGKQLRSEGMSGLYVDFAELAEKRDYRGEFDMLWQMRTVQGMPMQLMARELGVGLSTVRRRLKKNGLGGR